MQIENNREVSANSPPRETTVKVISRNKDFLDQIIDYLKIAFDCELTSHRMYNDEKDVFFQYLSISKRRP